MGHLTYKSSKELNGLKLSRVESTSIHTTLYSAEGAEMGRVKKLHPIQKSLKRTPHTRCYLGYRHLCTFSSISAAVCLVISKFSTNAVSSRKFPDADDSRESKLSSNVFKVILNPFCCFVRSDCK